MYNCAIYLFCKCLLSQINALFIVLLLWEPFRQDAFFWVFRSAVFPPKPPVSTGFCSSPATSGLRLPHGCAVTQQDFDSITAWRSLCASLRGTTFCHSLTVDCLSIVQRPYLIAFIGVSPDCVSCSQHTHLSFPFFRHKSIINLYLPVGVLFCGGRSPLPLVVLIKTKFLKKYNFNKIIFWANPLWKPVIKYF